MAKTAPTTNNPDAAGQAKPARVSPIVGVLIGNLTGADLGIQEIIMGARVELDINKINLAELYVKNVNVRLVNDILWSEGQLMHVFLGYSSDPEYVQLHGRYKMSRPRFEFKGRQTITIQGLGDGVEMTRIGKRRVFENMTYDQIIAAIAGEYDLKTAIAINSDESIPSMTQAGVSDYEFVSEMALRAGADFFVAGETIYFMPRALRQSEKPAVIDIQDPAVDVVVFSVEADGQAAVLSSSPINPRTGEFEEIASEFAPDDYLDLDVDGQVRFLEIASPRVIYVDGRGNLLSPSALQTMVDAEANMRKNIIKCRATVNGIENMTPRQTVAFINCGTRFVGPYYITKVTHEIRNGIFKTSFEGMRATTGEYQHAMTGVTSDTVGGTATPMRDVSGMSKREV